MVETDPRRAIPRTDEVLADPRVAVALDRLAPAQVKATVREVQQQARDGHIEAADVVDRVISALPSAATTLQRVINATGIVVHTNLGRAPLSAAAQQAIQAACGNVDVEYDLATGTRAGRGAGTVDALLAAVPQAQAALIVNNNAAALVLAATALASGREIVISRGEMVAIGDGFQLPELLTATGARLREVGTTNRTTAEDYRRAVGPETGFVLKVHPSNFVIEGFVSSVSVPELVGLGAPVVVDIGSGLLRPDRSLPDEPDATSALSEGADLVTASGDKLLGGPQCGLILGADPLVQQLRRHPLARALRTDKLTLAGLEATVRGPEAPVVAALHVTQDDLMARAGRLATELGAAGIDAHAVTSIAEVGGGGAPGVELPSAALALPTSFAAALRRTAPPVIGRVEAGRCLLDLRGVPEAADREIADAVVAASRSL